MAGINILLVEYKAGKRRGFRSILSAMGYDVDAITDNAEDAFKLARHVRPDLIILDISEISGTDWVSDAEKIREHGEIPLLLVTAGSAGTFSGFSIPPQFDYYPLPLDEEKLRTTIRLVMANHSVKVRLRKSEERYRTIAELGEDMIFIVNRERMLEYANTAVMMRFGSNGNQSCAFSTLPYLEVLTGSLVLSLDVCISRVVWWGEKIHRQDRIETAYGPEWYDSLLIPMKGKDNLVNAVIVVCRDITDRVRFEEKLREKGIRQIEKNNEKFQALNDQIRNPLQVIKSLIELEDAPFQEKILEQVEIIDSIVACLDEGWLESEKVRRFLIEHYHHGSPEGHERKELASYSG